MAKKIGRETLIDDIQRVYRQLGSPPSESEYQAHGNYSPSAVRREFGKYTAGRAAAEIPNPDMRGGNNRIPRDDLLDEIQRLGEELGKTPTRDEMINKGRYVEGPYRREFGSWSEALLAAGYTYDELNRPGHHVAERVTVECTICETTKERLASDLNGKQNAFCTQECLHTWRSEYFTGEEHPLTERIEVECEWCETTKNRVPAVAEDRTYHFCNYDCMGEWRSEYRAGEDAPAWDGGGNLYRGPNWLSQRRKVVERDARECQWCGLTEGEHFDEYDRQLSVHHLTTVREFYRRAGSEEPDFEVMNALKNLVTLCIPCHRLADWLPVTPEFEAVQ